MPGRFYRAPIVPDWRGFAADIQNGLMQGLALHKQRQDDKEQSERQTLGDNMAGIFHPGQQLPGGHPNPAPAPSGPAPILPVSPPFPAGPDGRPTPLSAFQTPGEPHPFVQALQAPVAAPNPDDEVVELGNGYRYLPKYNQAVRERVRESREKEDAAHRTFNEQVAAAISMGIPPDHAAAAVRLGVADNLLTQDARTQAKGAKPALIHMSGRDFPDTPEGRQAAITWERTLHPVHEPKEPRDPNTTPSAIRAQRNDARRDARDATERFLRQNPHAPVHEATNYILGTSMGFRDNLSAEELRNIASDAEVAVRGKRSSQGRTGFARTGGAVPATAALAAAPAAAPAAGRPASAAKRTITQDEARQLRTAGVSQATIDSRYIVR